MEVAAFNLLIHVLRPTKVIIFVHIKYNFIYPISYEVKTAPTLQK